MSGKAVEIKDGKSSALAMTKSLIFYWADSLGNFEKSFAAVFAPKYYSNNTKFFLEYLSLLSFYSSSGLAFKVALTYLTVGLFVF